jgi:hypothetical protein
MRTVTQFGLAAALMFLPALLAAQPKPSQDPAAATQSEVSFQLEREGLPVPRFTLRIREDGSGSYQAEQAARSSSDGSIRGEAAQHIDRPLTISSATTAKIFHAAHETDRFNITCASKAKNIANTGIKTLTYKGADGSGSCVYNFSENKTIVQLTDVFQGIAETLDEGRRLEFLHRYDRLGLDAEISNLAQLLEDGRALEVGTIASTLSALAEDTALIQRVRLRAASMLNQVQASR